MASETTADQMQVSEADKQKDIAKLDELLVEGLKKLDELDAESAVDLLSEAAKLAGSIYEAFAPEAYNAHMQYGRALIALASDEISKLHVKGESNDKKDETEETGQPDKTEDEPEIIAEESAGGGEITDADETLKPEENAEDELEEMLNDAWNVLEIAKQTCEKQLQSVKEDSDVRQWKLKMSEPLHFLGRVLILNGKPEEAKAEFTASLDIKQQLLDDDRTLADTFHEIAESFTNAYNFADAKTYFEKALEAFSKKIVSLEAAKDDKDTSAEIKELRDICKEVQDKITDVIESEKAVLDFKENVQGAVRSLPPVDSSSFNDVTHTIKRRIADSGDKQVEAELVKRPLADDDESDDIAAKKAKAQ